MPHDDPTVVEYAAEIARLTEVITQHRAALDGAGPEERKRIRRTLYTLYQGRGQLRRVVAYLRDPLQRLRT